MVSSCAFNQRGDVFAYATSYDWFQGPKVMTKKDGGGGGDGDDKRIKAKKTKLRGGACCCERIKSLPLKMTGVCCVLGALCCECGA